MPLDTPHPHDKATLELRKVSKFFGDLVALHSVDLHFEPGESVLLYGPNGAGKTTLLRLLSSLSRPSEGQILFAGEDLYRNLKTAKYQIGFVSHATFLYNELTVLENLKFIGTLFGVKDLDDKVMRVLDLFNLRPRADVPARDLSRGLQQRVALARAFLHEPTYLLLDEPFTGLDAQSTRNLQACLERGLDDGKSVVFSTHDFEQGALIARRLVALENGRVRYDGPLTSAPLAALGIVPATTTAKSH